MRLYQKTWPCLMAWPYGTMRVPSRPTLAFLPSYLWRMQEYETLPQTETSGLSSKSDLVLRTYMKTFTVVNGKVFTRGRLAGTLAGGCGGAVRGEGCGEARRLAGFRVLRFLPRRSDEAGVTRHKCGQIGWFGIR
jgi:hypothetical protein